MNRPAKVEEDKLDFDAGPLSETPFAQGDRDQAPAWVQAQLDDPGTRERVTGFRREIAELVKERLATLDDE